MPLKAWNGAAWVPVPHKVWNGTAWVRKPLKRWDGAAWRTVSGAYQVAKQIVASGSTSTFASLGAAIGDFYAACGDGTLRASGVITSANLNTSHNGGTFGTTLIIYRGVSGVADRVADSAEGPVYHKSTAGFSKATKSVGILAVVSGDGTLASTISLHAPAGFTDQGATVSASLSSLTYEALGDYTNGTPFVWSAGGSTNGIRVFELLG